MFSEEEKKKMEDALSTLVSFSEKACSSQDLNDEPGPSGTSCVEPGPSGSGLESPVDRFPLQQITASNLPQSSSGKRLGRLIL